jgi:glycosyltransferase involved in cell wall biosynthesis
MLPSADLYALISDRKSFSPEVSRANVYTSFLSRIPSSKRFYQNLMPLYPLAMGAFDLTRYDLVISSGGPATKGVLLRPDAKHIHYCLSPVRFLWDQFAVWRDRLPRLARPIFTLAAHNLREWDFNSAQRVDHLVAISSFISSRIKAYYRRESIVIYPPVDTARGYLSPTKEDFYLSVGRLVPGKRTELVVEACNRMKRRLIVVGRGPEYSALQSKAGKYTQILGGVAESEVNRMYAQARAFIFAAEEDFGIAPVEAQSFGLPVIAYGRGGCLETVLGLDDDGEREPTGLFFGEQSVDAICSAIERFERVQASFNPAAIQFNAQRFDTSIFKRRMLSLIQSVTGESLSPQTQLTCLSGQVVSKAQPHKKTS